MQPQLKRSYNDLKRFSASDVQFQKLESFFVTIQISEFAENYEIKFGRSFRVHILRYVILVPVIRNQLQSMILRMGCSVMRTAEIWLECRTDLKCRTFLYPEMLQY